MFSSHSLRKVLWPVSLVDSAFPDQQTVTCQSEFGLAMVSDSHCAEVHSELSLHHIPSLSLEDCISSLGAEMDGYASTLPCWNVSMSEELSQ